MGGFHLFHVEHLYMAGTEWCTESGSAQCFTWNIRSMARPYSYE